jgi:hypothetical protein
MDDDLAAFDRPETRLTDQPLDLAVSDIDPMKADDHLEVRVFEPRDLGERMREKLGAVGDDHR